MAVRRLAAIDMHGLYGRRWRARIILAEFLVGAIGGVAAGLWVLGIADGRVLGTVFGAWLVGAELRHYTFAQFWILVPLALVGFALRAGAVGG